jgi:exopolysaccharide production protein ExoQ
MKTFHSQLQPAGGGSPQSLSTALPFWRRQNETSTETPVSQEVLTWLLFWPLLTLIARHGVYFSGPAVTAADYQNGSSAAGPQGPHYTLYVYLLFLLGFVLVGHRQVWAVVKANPFIPAMLGLAVCSALWSDRPVITLQMCIQVGLCTLFACYLSARYTTQRLMELLIFMGVIAAMLSIFFALALPSYGIFQGYGGGSWQGICNHKNTLGVTMAFLLTPIFFTTSCSRGRRIVYGTLLLFLIYKSQSRGAWADTVVMLLFVAWLHLVRRIRERELALTLLLTGTAVTGAIAFAVYFWTALAASIGKNPTMTGRTQIYIEVFRSVLKHPILGYGFGTFWGGPEAHRVSLAVGWPNIGYAENGILEIALQTGALGVALVAAFIGKAFVRGMRLLRSSQYSSRIGWFLTVLLLALLTNIDAGWLMTANILDWALIVIACVGINDQIRHGSLILEA